MDIQAHQEPINETLPIAGTVQLYIPPFKHRYCWKTDQIDQLFADIRYEDENYYVGNLLVVPHEQQGKNIPDAYDVIDGQQRLTTVSLFLLAIWQRAQEISNDENTSRDDIMKTGTIQSDIKRRLIFNNSDDALEPRLHLLEEDDTVYRSLLRVLNPDAPDARRSQNDTGTSVNCSEPTHSRPSASWTNSMRSCSRSPFCASMCQTSPTRSTCSPR